ncbi:MAG: hypothetical protein PHU54_09540 [Candidatus Omnitrophica bacterium]|jgi:hypothetical protein|nr:hypothetical protein [Candidatus Omnitrophota bacterium]
MKRCSKCGELKPETEFYKQSGKPSGRRSECKQCSLIYDKLNRTERQKVAKKRRHRLGLQQPMDKNKTCPAFLGVYVAEQVLKNAFKTATPQRYGNKGFDFICGRGYKVDVKSSCRIKRQDGPDSWNFHIGKNTIADYFLCIAFDDRYHLNPEHLWLIKGDLINNKTVVSISESTLKKWLVYEQRIDKVIVCCNKLKNGTF